jgi:proline dehydrogenase
MGCNIRLCKGAYKEPPSIAFQKKQDVDRSLVRLIKICLESAAYTAIASHDHHVIDATREFIKDKGIATERYEFQMLYGVRREYQLDLRSQGYRMRIYVPFGTQWAPYFMRRLAERPANMLFTARAIFRG